MLLLKFSNYPILRGNCTRTHRNQDSDVWTTNEDVKGKFSTYPGKRSSPTVIRTWTRSYTGLSWSWSDTTESQPSRTLWTVETCCLLNADQKQRQRSNSSCDRFFRKRRTFDASGVCIVQPPPSHASHHITSIRWRDERQENSEASSNDLHTLLQWLTTSAAPTRRQNGAAAVTWCRCRPGLLLEGKRFA